MLKFPCFGPFHVKNGKNLYFFSESDYLEEYILKKPLKNRTETLIYSCQTAGLKTYDYNYTLS